MNRQIKTKEASIKAHILSFLFLSIVPPCSVQEICLVFGNVSKKKKKKEGKKERKRKNIYIYIYILLAFHVIIHVSVFACVIPSNISVSLAQKSDDNKTKLHNKPF